MFITVTPEFRTWRLGQSPCYGEHWWSGGALCMIYFILKFSYKFTYKSFSELTELSTENFHKRFVYKFNSKFLWARAHYHLSPLLNQRPFNNPAWVSTKGDNIQLFHLVCDHFIHKHVIYKINVYIIILLLSHLHQAFRDHYFQKFLENQSFYNCFKLDIEIIYSQKDFAVYIL